MIILLLSPLYPGIVVINCRDLSNGWAQNEANENPVNAKTTTTITITTITITITITITTTTITSYNEARQLWQCSLSWHGKPYSLCYKLDWLSLSFFLEFDGQTLQSPIRMKMCFQGSDHWHHQSVISCIVHIKNAEIEATSISLNL